MSSAVRQVWREEVHRILRRNGVTACIECGRCTASCPAALPSPLRARNVIRAVRDGDIVVVEGTDDIWHCTTCFDCQDRCPKGVKVTQAILDLRTFGSGLGAWPPPHEVALRAIASTGNTFPLEDEVRKVRSQLSLPLDPPDCAHDEEELACYKRLLAILEFDRLAPRLEHFKHRIVWNGDGSGEDRGGDGP